jgi:hypothetical protein
MSATLPPHYYETSTRYFAKHRLPLSFLTPQWEGSLPDISKDYRRLDNKGALVPLSPDAPLPPWNAVGRLWAAHPALKQVQALYPDPPLVLIVCNNEYPKVGWQDLREPGGDDVALRKAVGDAWIERYGAMLRGFRDGLAEPHWREHVTIIGYDAFTVPFVGRWAGWSRYSLYIPGRMSPWPRVWDGASVSYYVHDAAADSDYTVYSPEVETMNLVPAVDDVLREKPSYWFEMSAWDGQEPDRSTDKKRLYASRGQTLTAERFAGMEQFGMWLLRPRVVREFRNPTHGGVAKFGEYFEQTLAAVARVHENPVLERFWRKGSLVVNTQGAHPYQEAVPPELAAKPRWFLLDSDANLPRPWKLETPLKVFSLALENIEGAHREWLVYAFSPLDAQLTTSVRIPGLKDAVRVRATRGGCFNLIRDGRRRVEDVEC